MKHLVSYNIFESVKTIDEIYDKYYSHIEYHTFRKLIRTDPTSTRNKMGMYSKWIINRYSSKVLKFEDLFKATDCLKLYHRFKHTLPIEKRNIDNIKDLPALAEIVEPFKEPIPEYLSSAENKKAAFVKSFEFFDLYIPTTYEQSRDLGRGTEWCTAADSKYGKINFDDYIEKGKLYILISNVDKTLKYQFHFEERQFMNRLDSKIDIVKFLKMYPKIEEYFKPQMDEMVKYLNFKNYEIRKFRNSSPISSLYSSNLYFTMGGRIIMKYDKRADRLIVKCKEIIDVISILNPEMDYYDVCRYIKNEINKYYIFENFDIREAENKEEIQWDSIYHNLSEPLLDNQRRKYRK